jgi:hypothetical protein
LSDARHILRRGGTIQPVGAIPCGCPGFDRRGVVPQPCAAATGRGRNRRPIQKGRYKTCPYDGDGSQRGGGTGAIPCGCPGFDRCGVVPQPCPGATGRCYRGNRKQYARFTIQPVGAIPCGCPGFDRCGVVPQPCAAATGRGRNRRPIQEGRYKTCPYGGDGSQRGGGTGAIGNNMHVSP